MTRHPKPVRVLIWASLTLIALFGGLILPIIVADLWASSTMGWSGRTVSSEWSADWSFYHYHSLGVDLYTLSRHDTVGVDSVTLAEARAAAKGQRPPEWPMVEPTIHPPYRTWTLIRIGVPFPNSVKWIALNDDGSRSTTGDELLLPGTIANTLIYAAILLLLFRAPFWIYRGVRARRRRARGQCPACGYDLSATPSGPCPECGTPRRTPAAPQQ